MAEQNCSTFILVIIAFFLPPLGVFLKRPGLNADLIINICLTILGWIPGIIHAWWIILRNPPVAEPII
ncbi:plasma membrane proteolipid Pmp3 [Coemansia sp. D1744]|nr:plasma membrane proteolipid Pmp3 [Coemansia sp. D1744]